MHRPARANFRMQLRHILNTRCVDDVDFIDTKRKPHIYYW
jgi:hypothetical protein